MALIILVILSGVSWFFVLNTPARRKFHSTQWDLFNFSKQQREVDDAVSLAVSLVLAITFTTILLFALLVSILKIVS